MKNIITLAMVLTLSAGCSATMINDAFELPMHEFDRKYSGNLEHWTIDDIHVHVNRIVTNPWHVVKRPEINGTCLEAAEMKYDLAKENGHDPKIVVITLHPEVQELRGATSPNHAVLRVGDTIYDNGFIASTPFDADELSRYGTEIPNIWSGDQYQ